MIKLAQELFGAARAALLAALLLRPDDELHVRELARVAGMSAGTIHRELRALADLGLLLRREAGRQVFYRANRAHPAFEELAGLLRKSAGLPDVLRTALAPLRARVRLALIFGAVASGAADANGDIEVLVLGEAGAAQVARALAAAQALLGRRVEATVIAPDEFERRRRAGDEFVLQVLDGPKLLLIGTAAELADADAQRARRPASSSEVARELRDIRRNLEDASRAQPKED